LAFGICLCVFYFPEKRKIFGNYTLLSLHYLKKFFANQNLVELITINLPFRITGESIQMVKTISKIHKAVRENWGKKEENEMDFGS
jgi:hypothetical protein